MWQCIVLQILKEMYLNTNLNMIHPTICLLEIGVSDLQIPVLVVIN